MRFGMETPFYSTFPPFQVVLKRLECATASKTGSKASRQPNSSMQGRFLPSSAHLFVVLFRWTSIQTFVRSFFLRSFDSIANVCCAKRLAFFKESMQCTQACRFLTFVVCCVCCVPFFACLALFSEIPDLQLRFISPCVWVSSGR